MSNDNFGDHNGLDWQDWMIFGPLSEDIVQEEQEQNRIIKEFEDDEDDWDVTD